RSLLVRIATERQLLLIVLLVALVAGMAILKPTTFPRAANAAVVLLDTAQTGILACGMMVLMISGMFDLSIGGILAFSGIMAALAAKYLGFPPIPAFLVGCVWGVFLGGINGVLVTRFKINALIATLATLSIYRGGLQLVSGAGVTNIGNGYTIFGQTQILGIYSPFSSGGRDTSARPTISAAMPGRRSSPASMSIARCSAFPSSWGSWLVSPARCSPRASTQPWCLRAKESSS